MANTLEDRLLRLERQNRWMKRVGGCVLLLLLVTIAVGANRKGTNTGYTVTDARGKVRGYFGISQDGLPLIRLMDANTNVRAEIGMDKLSMPYLRMNDLRGRPRATVQLDKGEGGIWPAFNIHGSKGEVVAKLGASSNKAGSYGSFHFYDSNGTTRVAFGMNDNPYLVFYDKNGNEMQTLSK